VSRRRKRSDYVFPSRQTGNPLDANWVGRQFRSLLRRAGLGSFKLYDFRHSFASHLLDQGVTPVNVAHLMGYKRVTTTLNFYAHWIPQADMKRDIDLLTTARQAKGDLNGDFSKKSRRKGQ
jgi:integrase